MAQYCFSDIIFFVLVNSIVMWITMTTIPNITFNRKNTLILVFSMIICSIVSRRLHLLFTVFFLVLIVGLISEKPLINMILSASSYIISVLYNYVFLSFWNWITGISTAEIISSTYLQTIFYLAFFPTLYLVLRIIKALLSKLPILSSKSFKALGLCFFCILLACIAIITAFISYEYAEGYPKDLLKTNLKFFIIIFIMLTILFSIVVIILRNYVHMNYELKEAEQLKQYTDEVENMYRSLRSFKHDYTNVLCSMKHYLDNRDYDNLNEYYNSQVLPLSTSIAAESNALEQLSNISMAEIKSLLYFKIMCAAKNNINIFIESKWSIDKINIKSIDLTRILGILIDNAIDEVSGIAKDKRREITITFIKSETGVVIIVSNPTRDENFDITSLQKEGFSTKGNNHGLGLRNVRSIIKKYNNVLMSTTHKNGILDQIIEISDN